MKDIIIEIIFITGAITQIVAGSLYIFRALLKKKTKLNIESGNVKKVQKRKIFSIVFSFIVFFAPISVFAFYYFVYDEPLSKVDYFIITTYTVLFITGFYASIILKKQLK